ncbi:hypothetical protein H8356DRAFT_974815 [Neocallimastix lanati (nom. inval.)]|nr:hypothetical protein H8356DRAFT_974815 [Neocallimastix sp. JGI-2020a]
MKYIILISLLFFLINIGNAINISAVSFSFNGGGDIYKPMIDSFNKYAKQNNLDITVSLDLYTNENSTSLVTDYESMLDSLIQSDSYDLYFYDNIYSTKFGPHLLNIKEWISQEHLNLYSEGIASQSCVYNDKWVGLPINIDFAVIYSNPLYTNKYNVPAPKTWEELLESGKYIINEEAKIGNTDLIAYNGLFNSLESGTCSLYEFIYSYRNSVNDPYPQLPSQESIDALEMMKKLTQEINTESQFQNDDGYTGSKLMDGKFVFLKFWYLSMVTNYTISPIPGVREGISGSAIGGYNLGISNHIDDSKKQAAVTAFEFITSKDMQKKIIMKNKLYSGIPSLYDDEEVCATVDCAFFKSIQLVARPTSKSNNYSNYSEKFRNYIYEFLYGDKSAYDVLKKINDISKFYYLSLDRSETPFGLIIIISFIILTLTMVFSLKFIYMNKYKPYFRFIPGDMWILSVFGCILIMCTCFTGLGEVTLLKCQLKLLTFSVGFTLSLIPVFCKLIANFPDENSISKWVDNHKYIFLSVFILCDFLLYSLSFNTPYTIEPKLVDDGQNYQKCKTTKSGKLMVYLILISKLIIILCILFFTFVEWNMELTRDDIRYLSVALYMDIISFGVLMFINFMDLNNYIVYYGVPDFIYLFFAVTNYIFLYGFRIIRALMGKESEDEIFLKNFRKNTSSNGNVYLMNSSTSNKFGSASCSNNSSSKDLSNQLSSKILNYHYRKNTNNTSDFSTASTTQLTSNSNYY